MRQLSRFLVLLIVLVVTAATAPAAGAQPPENHFDTQLSGDDEYPPVDSAGTGYAAVEVSADGSSIDYRLYVNNLDDVTMAHIHVGAPGTNGDVAAFLFGPEDPGVVADGLLAEGTITESDLIEIPGVFDGTMSQFVELIAAGETYVNVHTETHPSGEIRGQLGRASFNLMARLSGDNEVPPVESDAGGIASFRVAPPSDSINFNLVTHGLVDTIQAHIHIGPAGVNGDVVAFLFGPADPPVTRNGILARGTITEADLIEVPDVFDGSMATLLDHLRAGTAYVNVHTMANPGGEIRGQVMGLPLGPGSAMFTDDDESVHEADIEVIANAGITIGCNPPENTEFCPDEELTRGQGAAFFTRSLNLTTADTDFFTDDNNSIFEDDINAVAQEGITLGCNPPENTEFCPNDSVTRGQWASFMVRALGLTEGGGDDLFVDDDESVHEEDIDRIATAGITLGCNPPDNTEFCPTDTVTRAQSASFFVRAMRWVPLD